MGGAREGDFMPIDGKPIFNTGRCSKRCIDTEPAYEAYRAFYGELAGLGLIEGQPFTPESA